MDISERRLHTLVILLSCVLWYTECARARDSSELVNSRIGEQVTLTCPVTGTFVNWYKDGRELTETEYIRISEEKLRIKNVTHEDQGFYSCKPIDGFGAGPSENNFTLMVYRASVSVFPENPTLHTTTERPKYAPSFREKQAGVTQPMSRNLTQSATFNCEAQGYPEPTVHWYKDGQPLNFQRDPDLVDQASTIKVKNLQISDSGSYECRVSNERGTINYFFNLLVKDPARGYTTITSTFPLNTSVTMGSTASLQCKVRSNSKPTIMWLRHVSSPLPNDPNLIKIRDKSYRLIKNETQRIEQEDDSYLNRLILPNVGLRDQGIYACVGVDKVGNSDMREAALIVSPQGTTTDLITTLDSTTTDWEYIFGSPSATLAVLIAIPVVIILMITIAIIYGLNKRKKNSASSIRRPPNNMMMDHEVAVPLNMNANNGCYSGQYNGSNGSYHKVPLANSDNRYGDKNMYHPPSYRSPTPQQYSQYMQSDGSYRSSLHYPPVAAVHQQSLRKQQRSQGEDDYMTDIPDSDSHFSSVSHTRPQYMNHSRNPYDDRDIHSDPPVSRIGHHCPPPPPGSFYSGQW